MDTKLYIVFSNIFNNVIIENPDIENIDILTLNETNHDLFIDFFSKNIGSYLKKIVDDGDTRFIFDFNAFINYMTIEKLDIDLLNRFKDFIDELNLIIQSKVIEGI